jgi:demethylmenaquinone methyltransferase/2-methoxy-6-polyprenyl-1,4-benzoquinol methylase
MTSYGVEPDYSGADKSSRVSAMFNHIAPTYDRLNRIISLGLDRRWRRRLLAEVLLRKPGRVLDVATGTGDFAIELAKAGIPHVEGIDIAHGMLDLARAKTREAHLTIDYRLGRAEDLPYPDETFEVSTVVFGVRNFESPERGLAELRRVTTRDGLVAILELSTPHSPLLALGHRWYSQVILPRLGALISGSRAAYRYLPESVAAFPSGERFAALARESGLESCQCIPLHGGLVTIYLAQRGA